MALMVVLQMTLIYLYLDGDYNMKPKIIVDNATKRVISFGYCDFTPEDGQTVYNSPNESLPDNPKFCIYDSIKDEITVDQTYKEQYLNQRELSNQLTRSDSGMSRVVEDLVALLESKGILNESELPQTAQDKLTKRRNLRNQIND